MSLGDRQHVEAVAIIRALRDTVVGEWPLAEDFQSVRAADQWLKENHPAPSVYMAAMQLQDIEASGGGA